MSDEAQEKMADAVAALDGMVEATPEQLQAAEEGATEAAEAWLGAWAAEDWTGLQERCQETWRAAWGEKVQQTDPEPLDARLVGEGEHPDGPSWKEATGGTLEGLLEQLIGCEELVVWTVVGATARSRVMVDVEVDAVVRDRYGTRSRQKRTLVVVKERAAWEPDPDEGEWGVNPVSARRTA